MIILIPLGGIGSRFSNANYKLPKPLINVMGKPIIFWLLDNLHFDNIDLIVIPYNKSLSKYRFEDKILKNYPKLNFKFIQLQNNTQGAAETISIALNTLSIDDKPILCIDGDNFYLQNIIKEWNGTNSIFTFHDNSDSNAFSYVKIINQNKIETILEKEKISNWACCGSYGFNSWYNLKNYCQNIINNNIKDKGEFYTSTVIKQMLNNGINFEMKIVENKNYICLGTPLHVRLFYNNFPVYNAFNNKKTCPTKRYCFDLDNTLVTYPKINGDYTSVKPIQENINFLKYIKKMGNTIIIYTARRMKTHFGCQGKLLADIGKITFDTLDKFDIPYDEIYFGKPYADYYIDDLAISAYDNFQKELGYYQNNIEPRHFNKISNINIQTYRKSGNDLSGEIYYYQNIPNEIKDMFPTMLNYDDKNFKYYDMDKINGITVSTLYTNGELTLEQFEHIFNSIQRIQKIKSYDNINIYSNYINKINNRFKNFDYSKYKDANKLYQYLLIKLESYQKYNKGKQTVIHGDPVFTNILINQFGKIKFIDMRGKQGNDLSIEGDWLYDWAKIYQSLIGYDEILNDKYLNLNYKKQFIDYFIQRFKKEYGNENFNNLLTITKSLIFSLIPLHIDENKLQKYYELCWKII